MQSQILDTKSHSAQSLLNVLAQIQSDLHRAQQLGSQWDTRSDICERIAGVLKVIEKVKRQAPA